MDKEALRQFLINSNRAGYAAGDEKQWIKESDGSTTIPFKKGKWRSHDNYFGGEPYGGRVVVFYEEKPAWLMVYYGWVAEGIPTDPVYKILRNALMHMPEDRPFRGPKEYKEDDSVYTNSWDGDIERFSGEEKINQGNTLIYKANYIGGLVDQRSGV
jgi:hypothetical protein